MPRAVAAPPLRDPGRCLTAISQTARELTENRGVQIVYTTLPNGELSDWHGGTRTLFLASDAAVEDQLWTLVNLWLLLVVGPHAADGAHRVPLLQLVPAPRSAGD